MRCDSFYACPDVSPPFSRIYNDYRKAAAKLLFSVLKDLSAFWAGTLMVLAK
jgi:hypothetical protein